MVRQFHALLLGPSFSRPAFSVDPLEKAPKDAFHILHCSTAHLFAWRPGGVAVLWVAVASPLSLLGNIVRHLFYGR